MCSNMNPEASTTTKSLTTNLTDTQTSVHSHALVQLLLVLITVVPMGTKMFLALSSWYCLCKSWQSNYHPVKCRRLRRPGWLVKPKFHYANFATKSGTSSRQSRGRVADTNHESLRHKSRRRLSWFVSRTLSPTLLPTFPVHCNGLNSIRATQTGLLRTCHELCRKHLDMSSWFVSATFVICVGDFYRNFMVSWFVTVCPRLSWFVSTTFPVGKFR